jgi:hypothetical protein
MNPRIHLRMNLDPDRSVKSVAGRVGPGGIGFSPRGAPLRLRAGPRRASPGCCAPIGSPDDHGDRMATQADSDVIGDLQLARGQPRVRNRLSARVATRCISPASITARGSKTGRLFGCLATASRHQPVRALVPDYQLSPDQAERSGSGFIRRWIRGLIARVPVSGRY